MSNKHLILTILVTFLGFQSALSQQHSSCPIVLDESISIYQPPLSAIICEYDELGKCINSFERTPLLSAQLNYFDTRFRSNGVELVWQSKTAHLIENFTVLRSKDGEQYHKIAEISSLDFQNGNCSYLDNLPLLGNNKYILKKVEDGKTILSNPVSVYVSLGICHLETMDIKSEKDEVSVKYFVDNAGVFQLLVTDSEGHEHSRKNVALRNGKNHINFSLPQNGIYFVTITNGFSSLTDLVVQSTASEGDKSAVASESEQE